MRNLQNLNRLVDSMKVELEANTKVVVGLLDEVRILKSKVRHLEDATEIFTTSIDKNINKYIYNKGGRNRKVGTK